MKMVEAIGHRLKDIIAEKGVTQYALAKKAAVHASILYNIFYNRVTTINVDTLWVIVDALDMTMIEFFDHPLFTKENIDS